MGILRIITQVSANEDCLRPPPGPLGKVDTVISGFGFDTGSHSPASNETQDGAVRSLSGNCVLKQYVCTDVQQSKAIITNTVKIIFS